MTETSPAVLLNKEEAKAVLNEYIPGVVESAAGGGDSLCICVFDLVDVKFRDSILEFVILENTMYYDERQYVSGENMKNVSKERPINTWNDLRSLIREKIELQLKVFQTNKEKWPEHIAILQNKLIKLGLPTQNTK